MARTATRQRLATPPPRETDQAVAVFQAPRLPWHPEIERRFNVSRAEWRALTDAVFPTAKSADSIMLALSYCRARRLDIFKRPVHIVPIWDSRENREIESVWPGIGELRTTASRTGVYAGLDEPVYGPERTETFRARVKKYNSDDWHDEESTVTFPEWCQVTVHKIVQGQRVPFPGPKVRWLEYYTRKSRYSALPNEMWARKAFHMLEKCAEAAALRRAFPEELGEEFTMEEAGALGAYSATQVHAEVVGTTAPQEPTRADYLGEEPAAEAQEESSTEVSPEPDPEAGDGHAESSGVNWRIEGVVGEAAVIKALKELIDTAATAADVQAVIGQNADRLSKMSMMKRTDVEHYADARVRSLAAETA